MTPKEAMENKENNHEESLSSLKISIPIKKESKSERISRASKDIPANFERLRGLLDHFGTSCLFCQQAQTIQVDAIFLLSHLLILHDRYVLVQCNVCFHGKFNLFLLFIMFTGKLSSNF